MRMVVKRPVIWQLQILSMRATSIAVNINPAKASLSRDNASQNPNAL